jgi:hypothetical protein
MEVFSESDAAETTVHREWELDRRTTIRGHFDVIAALMQVAAEVHGVSLHAAEARREFGKNEQEPQNLVPAPARRSHSLPDSAWLSVVPQGCVNQFKQHHREWNVNVLSVPAGSTGILFEVVKRNPRVLANLDEVAVWIAHI